MANTTKNKGTLRRVLRRIRRHTPLLLLSLGFGVVSVALSLYLPRLVGYAIDEMIGPGAVKMERVLAILAQCLLLIGGAALATFLMSLFNNRISYHVVRDLRNDAFAKLEKLPLSYLDAHAHGDIVSRVIADADQFSEGLLLGFSQLFTGALTILWTLAMMLELNVFVALVVICLTPLSLFVARFIASRTYHLFRRQSTDRAAQTALALEMIGAGKLNALFGQEDEVLARFDETNSALEDSSLRATFYSSLTNPATRFINSMVYAGVALCGALVALGGGGMTVGALSCFLSYANQYTKPFNEISGVVTELQNALACASRLLELIDETPECDDAGLPRLSDVSGNVALDRVAFSYTEEKPLIRDLSLSVKAGERIAIVGPTGCGKTTLINLLMRFYDVKEGAISVEGEDIRAVTRHSLRESYGMVLQETWLRTATVRENIAMGRPDATDEEIVAAARAAHADSFIKRLSNGYDTVIGEEGGSLSQGQRQLLCIARIMLTKPPMLILDEATSSIDTRTELRIQAAFSDLMQGRTSFIVAHRLSTIREADVILVMRDGNVVEQAICLCFFFPS